MSTDRRFSEEEIAAIFEHAADAQRMAHDHPSGERGLTLTELQEIGAEAGISAEFVTRAAASIERENRAAPRQTFLGLPVSASHTVDIPGPFTDEEWDRLVVDLRQTFQARGEINRDGSLREWRNSNLYALVEPTESGARLRFGTVKGDARYSILGGVGWFVWWLSIALVKMAQSGSFLDPKVLFLSLLAMAGLGFAGFAASRLPAWSNKRQRQMQAVADRTLRAKGIRPAEVRDRVDSHVATSGETLLEIPEDAGSERESQSRPDRIRG